VRGLASHGPTEWCISVAYCTLSKGTFVLLPVGTLYHGTLETRLSWQGATEAFSHRRENRQEERALIPWLKPRGFPAHFL
jgi:hypothetical protein